MIVITGLGNPGLKYKKTRHNLGFIFVDRIRKEFNFPRFTNNSKLLSKISEGKLDSEKILLAKPQTFMNNSGHAIQKIVSFYKLNPENNLVIIYDDIDIPQGKIKTSGTRSGGHKGMESIISTIKTSSIKRIRIGIKPSHEINTSKYVLSRISKSEMNNYNINISNFINNTLKNYLKNK